MASTECSSSCLFCSFVRKARTVNEEQMRHPDQARSVHEALQCGRDKGLLAPCGCDGASYSSHTAFPWTFLIALADIEVICAARKGEIIRQLDDQHTALKQRLARATKDAEKQLSALQEVPVHIQANGHRNESGMSFSGAMQLIRKMKILRGFLYSPVSI